MEHGTRVAYVKFMANKIKREVKFLDEELGMNPSSSYVASTTFEHEKRTDSARSSNKSLDRVFRESIVSFE